MRSRTGVSVFVLVVTVGSLYSLIRSSSDKSQIEIPSALHIENRVVEVEGKHSSKAETRPSDADQDSFWINDSPKLYASLDRNEAGTLELLSQFDSSIDYGALLKNLFEYYRDLEDLNRSLSAVEALNDNQTVSAPLLTLFVEAFASENQDETWEWIRNHSAMNGIENAAHTFGKELASDAQDVSEILEKMPPDELPVGIRRLYLTGVVGEWLERDFDEALTYLNQLPNISELDGSIYYLVDIAKRIDAASTMSWSESIQDEGLRRSAIIETAVAWAEENRSTYEAWKSSAETASSILEELP